MTKLGWLLRAVKDPAETITFVISAGLFVFALYYSSPFYQPEYITPLTVAFSDSLERYIVSGLFVIMSIPGIYGTFAAENKMRLLKLGSFFCFIAFLFLCILRWVAIGLFPITWLPLIMLSLISGLLRLYYGVKTV